MSAQAGVLVGAALAPRLRYAFSEPRIIIGSLGVTMVGGIVAAVLGGAAGAMLLCFLMGITSGTAKQAFDALVQRDAPDANRGRSFARFETKFQLAWVLGAAMPLILPFPLVIGYVIIGVRPWPSGSCRTGWASGGWPAAPTTGSRRAASWCAAGCARSTPRWPVRASPVAPTAPTRADDPTALLAPPASVGAGVAAAGSARRSGSPLPPGSPSSPESSDSSMSSSPGDVTEWSPPPGFVSRGLNDDPTTVEGPAPAPAPPIFDAEAGANLPPDPDLPPPPRSDPRPDPPSGAEPAVEQPTLPLDFVEPADEPSSTAEPRWRDSPR